ncbi:MAG: thioredoxin [Chromatiales bacterium]|jgi:hypothetical protein|nr:thioredoxin [Chromatiales bacterium]
MELIALVKRDCETCQLVVPVLATLRSVHRLTIYSQDDPSFPEATGGAEDDRSLEHSWRHQVEVVPTLIRIDGGGEVGRVEGWDRAAWLELTELGILGDELPPYQPGCGSRTCELGMPERLSLRFGDLRLQSRRIEVPEEGDPIEIAFERGWSDGLPVVPPTELRVARMLSGTTRKPDEIVGLIPPDLAECTVEKVAINAVMAGCAPEYLPVVLAAVDAALAPEFSMHGLLATLWFSGPVVIVNGPLAKRVGMNSGGNALGQGNRANATIGRALQLLIRNVGGGRPGEIDRSVLGQPGKYTFCFAEDESDPGWMPLNVARGASPGDSSVTLFHGDGVQGVQGRMSRTPEGLCRTLAASLWVVGHPKTAGWAGAILVLGPDHHDIFKAAGWGRADVEAALRAALQRPGRDLVEGAQGMAEGIPRERADEMIDKFNEGYLLVVRAGGRGGAASAVIGGWTGQRRTEEVQIVTRNIKT